MLFSPCGAAMSRLSCPLETSRLEPGKRRKSRPEARGQRGERAFVWPEPSSQSRCRTHRGGQWTLIPLLCSAARTEGPATSETGEDGVLHRGPQGHRHVPQVLPRKGDGRQNGRKAHEEPEGRPGWSPQASGCCGVSPPWAPAPGRLGTRAACDPAGQR